MTLTRDQFVQRFGTRAVIGMVHLGALPGAPLFNGSLDSVIAAARRDAQALQEGGAQALLFENFGDRPFHANRVEAVTVAAMTRVITTVIAEIAMPFGVNVLRNDVLSALAIAAATGGWFVRVNIHTGAMLTDQGVITGEAAQTMRLRAELQAGNIAVFADHLVKHAVPLGLVDPVQAARDLRLRGLADAIIVTGAETGAPPDPSRFELLRNAIDAPVIIGSGVTSANASGYGDADAVIVGSSLKSGGLDSPVDAGRVQQLVQAFRDTARRR